MRRVRRGCKWECHWGDGRWINKCVTGAEQEGVLEELEEYERVCWLLFWVSGMSRIIHNHPLSTTHYPVPTTDYYPLLTIQHPLPTINHPISSAHYPPPSITTHYPLPTTQYPLLITHHRLLTTHYPPTINLAPRTSLFSSRSRTSTSNFRISSPCLAIRASNDSTLGALRNICFILNRRAWCGVVWCGVWKDK